MNNPTSNVKSALHSRHVSGDEIIQAELYRNPDSERLVDLHDLGVGRIHADDSVLAEGAHQRLRDRGNRGQIQIANRHLDHDRASNQVNGERKKIERYSLLKKPENLSPAEAKGMMDITKDNELVGLSYQMKESLRDVFRYRQDEIELARVHLAKWAEWASEYGSKGFKALAKTIRNCFDGIIRAIETGINNGYQESLNGRVQMSKNLARGYKDESRLGRIVYFRDSCRHL